MKFLRLIAVLVFLAIAAALATAYWGWDQLNQSVEVDTTRLVQIPRGIGPNQAAKMLADAGVIASDLPLKVYMKVTGAGSKIKAGDYYFPSPISPIAVLQKLEEGGQGANRITIIEGWNRWDISGALARVPDLHLKTSDSALPLMKNTDQIKDLDPKATSLEGYMFPDTYFVYSTNNAQEMIEQMVTQFHSIWESKLAQAAKSAGRSVHDVVTVASIIETEAKLPEERPIVASVIYNRLKRNIPLSVDSTIVYASKLAGKWKGNGIVYQSDIDRDSPYNLRKYKGLPPGPVGSPGVASMMAAINPASTNYLFYVRNPARNDGAHNFYTRAEDFEYGVKALRAWEEEQKRKGKR